MLHSVVIAETGYRGNTAPLVGDYEKIIPLAGEIGFDAVQLSVNRPEGQPAGLLRELTGRHGVAISSIATGMGFSVDGLCLTSADRENRSGAVKRMTAHVALSKEIGRPKVVIGAIRGFAPEGMTPEQYLGNLRDSCSRILENAVKNGVTVLLEATDRLETNVMLTVEETLDFIRSFRTPNFMLQLDTMHSHVEREELAPLILKYGESIGQVDLSGVERAVPADGQGIDFPGILDALRRTGYGHYLVYEFLNDGAGNNARAGLGYVRSALNKR